MTEKQLTGEVDKAQIDKWKADPNIKGVHGIIVGGHIGYIKSPDRATISYALSKTSFKVSPHEDTGSLEMNMGDLYKKGEAILAGCWLGGSEEIRNNNKLYVGACMKAGELVEIVEGEIKNF